MITLLAKMPLRYLGNSPNVSLDAIANIIKRDSPITDDILDHLFLCDEGWYTSLNSQSEIGTIMNGRFTIEIGRFMEHNNIEIAFKMRDIFPDKEHVVYIKHDTRDLDLLKDSRIKYLNIYVGETQLEQLKLDETDGICNCKSLFIYRDTEEHIGGDITKYDKLNPQIVAIRPDVSKKVINYFMKKCHYMIFQYDTNFTTIRHEYWHKVFTPFAGEIYNNLLTNEKMWLADILGLVNILTAKSARK